MASDDIFLPVRLNVWKAGEPIEHVTQTNSGNEISSVEIPGSAGKPIFAVEEGTLHVDQWAADNNAAELEGRDGRIWNYRHFRATDTGDTRVSAGDKIGVAVGNLIFGVMDDESDTEQVGPNQTQALSRNPMPTLDELDVLPLPQDQPKGGLSTTAERSEASEALTDFNDDKTIKTVAIVAGAGIGLYLIAKLIK